MINIPSVVFQQAERQLASVRKSISEYRDDLAELEKQIEGARRRIAACEIDEAELTTFLVQIGVLVPQGDLAARAAEQGGDCPFCNGLRAPGLAVCDQCSSKAIRHAQTLGPLLKATDD